MSSEILKTLESGLIAGMKHPRNAPASPRDREDSTPFPYTVYSCAEVLTLPRPQWRVKDVLPGTGLAAIFGPSRAGKSFLALDLALAVARGADWFSWKTVSCPVLYVNLESSWGMQGRLKAWMQERRRTLPENMNFILDSFDLQNMEQVQGIIHAAPVNGVVIIDTLNRASPGTDENSSRDMGNIIKAAATIQEATNSLVLFVAHSGKDARRGIRGHTSFIAALDAAIEVDRQGDARVLKLDKVKEGQDGIVQGFQLKTVAIGDVPCGSETTSCVVEPVARVGKAMSLSPAFKYALDSFDKSCVREDKEDIHVSVWRPVFYAGHTAGTTDAKRKAFDRARKELVERGILAVHDDIYTRTSGFVPDKADLS